MISDNAVQHEVQIFCVTHKENPGPFNKDSDIQKQHITDNDTKCIWEKYNPEVHVKNYAKVKVQKKKDNGDDDSNPVEKIYDFARTHIRKIIVSNTDNNQVFVLFENNGHLESLDLNSSRARSWIKSAYHKIEDRIYGDEAYKSALGLIRSHAIMDNTPRAKIYNRIAMPDENTIYCDLADSDWNLVKVTKEGVDIVPLSKDTPIFVRRQQQQTQLIPQLEDNDFALDELTSLLRIKNEDKRIFQIHLISLFLENCPIPIMPIVGEHGSIKSTITRSIKQIVDPAGEGNSSLPRNHNDLILFFNNRYLANFDNVSEFNQEVSDTFCKAITGDGQSKRALYENSDEIIYNYQRKIIFNGISPSLDFADFRDRCLSYETVPLKNNERMTEEQFNENFAKLIPRVLGKIFQTLSETLKLYESVKDEILDPPRMADFTIYGECISRALNFVPFSFVEDYKNRIQTNSIDIVESFPIISLIEKVMKDINHYEETVASFYRSVKAIADQEETEINSKNVNFPQASNKVKRHIQKLKPNFRSLGYEIDIQAYNKRDGKHPRGSHIIYITRIDTQSSTALNNGKVSLPSQPSLSEKNEAQNATLFDRDGDRQTAVIKKELLSKTGTFGHEISMTEVADVTDIIHDNSFSEDTVRESGSD